VLELGESILDGLVREASEETGLVVEAERLTGIYKNMARGIVALVFRCRIIDGRLASSPEASETAWLSAATCLLAAGPVPGKARSRRPVCRSLCGCPRMSCGSHLACAGRASLHELGVAQEGFALLEVAVPSQLDNRCRSSDWE
jgi:hypothetical protein